MNNYRSIIWRFFTVFFFIFLACSKLFVLCTGHLSSISCKWIEYTSNLTLHGFRYYFVRFILYDLRRWPGKFVCHKKSRLIICSIPCVLICSVLSVNYGLPSLILDLLGIADRGTGISIWLIAVILSSAVLILALYLLERHYRRVGEKYDSALSQYKNPGRSNTCRIK